MKLTSYREDNKIMLTESCSYAREDNNEQDYFFCNCSPKNSLNLICAYCAKNCSHAQHGEKISIKGSFECFC